MAKHSLKRNKLLELALKMCGRVADDQNPTVSQYSKSADVINMVHSNTMNSGAPLIQIELKSQAVTTTSFTLDSVDDDIYLIYTSSNSIDDEPLTRLDRNDYYALSDKTDEGTPRFFYVDYQDPRVCYLYPTPSSVTVKYLAIKQFDELSANTTIPLDNRYYLWLLYETAAILGDFYQLDIKRTAWLKKQALEYKKQVTGRDKQRGTNFRKGYNGNKGNGYTTGSGGGSSSTLNDDEAIHDDESGEINAITEKTTLADADEFLLEDSAASYAKKKVTYANIKGGISSVDTTAIHKATASEISAITEKVSPASGDFILIEDSADANSKKRVQVGNLPTGTGMSSFDLAGDSGTQTITNGNTVTVTGGTSIDTAVTATDTVTVSLDTATSSAISANTSKITYPSADSTKVGYISVTQAVNLDTMESNIATNNAKATCDATNVNSSGAVMESDYNANTILAATSDNTPVTLTVAEQTLVGRITAGNIGALTATEVRTLLNVEDGATANTGTVDTIGSPLANYYARFTDGDTIEGRNVTNVRTDLSISNVENTALSTWAGSANITTVGTLSSGNADAVVTDASVAAKGKVELATTAETTTGTDTTRAVTPEGLKDGYLGSENITTLGTIGTGTWQGTAIANTYIDSGIADNKIVEIDSATVASGEYAKFTASGLESKTFAEVRADLGVETTLTDDDTNIPSSGAIFDVLSGRVINEQTDNYELTNADRVKHIIMNKGTAVTLTIPAYGTTPIFVRAVIPILNIGAGELTIAITTDTLSEADSQFKLAQGRAAYIYHHSTTVWWLVGETNA